jgi:hypothetical protein
VKTYPIGILRQAFFQLIDRNNYVKFTLYTKPSIGVYGKQRGKVICGRPLKCKGKINNLFADKDGLKLQFDQLWVNHRINWGRLKVTLPIKNIRWIDSPFDEKKLEDLCIILVKKLPLKGVENVQY